LLSISTAQTNGRGQRSEGDRSVTDDLQLGVLVKKMPTRHTIANLTSSHGRVMQWFLHLAGLGLIPLGLLDGSFVPILPGSMDIAMRSSASRIREACAMRSGRSAMARSIKAIPRLGT
jgi:hypothetical protein